MKVHDKEHTGKNLADLAAQVFNKQVDTAVITSIPAQEGSGLVNHSPPPSSKKEALEQKPDVELRKKLESEFNTFRNSVYTTESSAPILNDFLWFFDKYTALQSENQRLTEEIKKLLKRLDGPKPKRKCPNCNSTRIVVFTSDDDICLTCNKVLPGE